MHKYNLFKYTNTLKYTHKYSLNLRKNEKIENFENFFQIESLGSGFHYTFHWT